MDLWSHESHYLPPSASDLVALSTLEFPSPILVSLDDTPSSGYIPILLDEALFDEIWNESASVHSLSSLPERGSSRSSVGTFGPQLPRSNTALSLSISPLETLSRLAARTSLAMFSDKLAALNPSQTTSTVLDLPNSPSRISISPTSIPSSASLPPSRSAIPIRRPERQPSSSPRSPVLIPHVGMYGEMRIPVNLLWLKDIAVELLLDQEGFRTVHPVFKLAGISDYVRGWDQPVEGGYAVFRPVTRDAYRFHYAPLDGNPMLRRLTVNSDDSHEYLSRQATLTIKSSCVYTVQGCESCHLPSAYFAANTSHSDGAPKLRWKFEYLVGDRLDSGKLIDGEKTLAPLTFVCSPWLLHSSQAKKIKLMRIVKKTVASKLVAEKVEPPTWPVPPLPSPVLRSNHLWPLHRRVHSHSGDQKMKKKPETPRADYPSARRDGNAVQTRRRRASSAGDEMRPGKHIVSPAKLARLLDQENVPPLPVGLGPALRR